MRSMTVIGFEGESIEFKWITQEQADLLTEMCATVGLDYIMDQPKERLS